MAYNVGNELKAQEAPDLLVNFMHTMAAQIRSWDGGNHLITTGMISTRHAFMAGNDALRMKLYSSPNLDFITNHAYHGDNNDAPSIEDDSDLSIRLSKPLLIEEAGFVGQRRPVRLVRCRTCAGWWTRSGRAASCRGASWWAATTTTATTRWVSTTSGTAPTGARSTTSSATRLNNLANDNAVIDVPKPESKFTVGQTVLTQTTVNMRKAPGLAGALVQQLAARTQVVITGESQTRDGLLWWPVEVPTLTGFVAQTNKSNVTLLVAA